MPKEVGKGRVLRIGKRRALSVSVSLQLRETGGLHSVARQVITCVMNAAALGVSIISIFFLPISIYQNKYRTLAHVIFVSMSYSELGHGRSNNKLSTKVPIM